MLESRYSFKFLPRAKIAKIYPDSGPKTKISENQRPEIDSNKRAFLKLAGVIGAGALATTLLPRKAEALVFGSTPTSNTVNIKDSNNVKINPAKEDGNLATIVTNTGNLSGLHFDGENLKVTSTGGSGVDVVGLKDAQSVRINPASDDSIVLLRRMAKMMESLAVVDISNRQKVVVESAPSTAVTGTLTGVTTVATVTTVNQLAGVDSRWQILDWSRQVYNSGMRGNLSW